LGPYDQSDLISDRVAQDRLIVSLAVKQEAGCRLGSLIIHCAAASFDHLKPTP